MKLKDTWQEKLWGDGWPINRPAYLSFQFDLPNRVVFICGPSGNKLLVIHFKEWMRITDELSEYTTPQQTD